MKLAPIATALMSSSCCIIQLMLNFFSISCAGFAVFTPYRSILSSITLGLLSYDMYHRGFKNRASLLMAILCISLMISPEIVEYINQHDSTVEQGSFYYRIQLHGLGCEACANRIKNTLNSMDWVLDTRVFFNNATAIVQTLSSVDSNSITEAIEAIDSKYSADFLDFWK